MKEFYNLFEIMRNNPNEKYALATITGVFGSSYRKVGAKMMIGLDGSSYGIISGGCLEEDLYYRAIDVITYSRPQLITYDLLSEDDLGWGQGAGCNGVINVYVEPFYWNYQSKTDERLIYELLADIVESEKEIIVAKIIDRDTPKCCYYSGDGILIGKTFEFDVKQNIILDHLQQFMQEDSSFESVYLDENNQSIIFERYEPKDRLYIFGAGPDAEPLVEFAAKLDFSVRVIDPRESRCNKRNFCQADSLIVNFPTVFFTEHHIQPDSYVIIMNHNFERDKEILHYLADRPLKYLGILGPKRRTERLMSLDNVPEYIHSPIGLDIDAEGAEEISLSILAEIINVRNSKLHSHFQI